MKSERPPIDWQLVDGNLKIGVLQPLDSKSDLYLVFLGFGDKPLQNPFASGFFAANICRKGTEKHVICEQRWVGHNHHFRKTMKERCPQVLRPIIRLCYTGRERNNAGNWGNASCEAFIYETFHGTLDLWLKCTDHLNDMEFRPLLLKILRDVVKGLMWLVSHGICHGNLNKHTIVVNDYSKSDVIEGKLIGIMHSGVDATQGIGEDCSNLSIIIQEIIRKRPDLPYMEHFNCFCMLLDRVRFDPKSALIFLDQHPLFLTVDDKLHLFVLTHLLCEMNWRGYKDPIIQSLVDVYEPKNDDDIKLASKVEENTNITWIPKDVSKIAHYFGETLNYQTNKYNKQVRRKQFFQALRDMLQTLEKGSCTMRYEAYRTEYQKKFVNDADDFFKFILNEIEEKEKEKEKEEKKQKEEQQQRKKKRKKNQNDEEIEDETLTYTYKNTSRSFLSFAHNIICHTKLNPDKDEKEVYSIPPEEVELELYKLAPDFLCIVFNILQGYKVFFFKSGVAT